jgi:hypothetical protein
MRKATVEVLIKLEVDFESGFDLNEIMNELDYSFKDNTCLAKITNTEMLGYETINAEFLK